MWTIKVDHGTDEDEIVLATVVITVQTWKEMIMGVIILDMIAMATMEPAFVVVAAVVAAVVVVVVAIKNSFHLV